ncbi:MAG: SURF1 family protein [Gemmatimonadaceae bacterium]
MLAASLAISAACITLGVWQLERLRERRDFNAVLAQRLAVPPVPISQLPTDTANARYRRILIKGNYDYANEFVLTSRTRQGSPGVNIITPVRISGSDTSVLVNRGWIYAPDGMTADLGKWREQDSVAGIGYVATYPAPGKGNAAVGSRSNAYRWLEYKVLAARTPYPLARFHLVLAADSAPVPRDVPQSIPPRLPEPIFDEGPHRGYAFQWFSFAVISIIGTYLFLRRK